MTITQTISRKRLEEIANLKSDLAGKPFIYEDARRMASILLTKLDSEPVDEFVSLIARLAYSLKIANPDSELPAKSLDYLQRRGFKQSPLRAIAPSAEPVSQSYKLRDDYFAYLVASARQRAIKAMEKFPQPNYVLNKVAEENGEVIKAVIHYTEGRETWENVEGELIDNLAMLIRLVTEGDQVIGFTPPESCRAAMLNPITFTNEDIKQSANYPVIPDGWVLVPNKLTAENGAKNALSGEFSEIALTGCPECFGDDECETCDGSGRIEIRVPVSWTNIKEIWAKGVDHFSTQPAPEA